MRLPPLLLGATLLFWGWETDLLYVGATFAMLAEGVRLVRWRGAWTDEEFNRVWNVCALIFIAASVYAFTANQGPAAFARLAEDPNFATQRLAGESSQKIAAALIQWLPMIFFPFQLALTINQRAVVKLAVLSLITRRKPRRNPAPLGERKVNAEWIYFAVALVSASINSHEGRGFFLGLAGLLAWALWSRRSQRFARPVWVALMVAACAIGYVGQQQLGELRRFVENFNPQWFAHGSGRGTDPGIARTEIGKIGKLKQSGTIVIRLELKDGTPAPALLRTASYRTYANEAWSARRSLGEFSDGQRNPRRSGGGSGGAGGGFGGRSFGSVQPESKSSTWVFRTGNAPMRLHLATYVDDVNDPGDPLPLPLGFTRFEDLPVATLKTNHLGVVAASGASIMLFDVLYGPGGSIDSAPESFDGQDNIPTNEIPALASIITEMNLGGKTKSQRVRAVSAFFQDRFTYSLWQKARYGSRTRTPLTDFLAPTNRSGHCEYFATATVLLLRQLGIPARYAVGWSVQEMNGTTGVIRERHAHAWCIYYLNDQWHDLDTTPAAWVAAENEHTSMLQFLGDAWSRLKFEFLKWRAGQSNLRDYIWWIVGPMLLFLLYRLIRRKDGPRARPKSTADIHVFARLGLDSEFYLVEKKLAEFGFVRTVGETLGQFLERALRDARVAAIQDVLLALLRAHYRLRFDPLGLAADEREALRHHVRAALDRLGEARRT